MEQLTISLVLKVLDDNDPGPVSPTKEQLFFAFMVCKNLSDLCDTGLAILKDIAKRGKPLTGLPDDKMINLCETVLKGLYTDNMFIDDDEIGTRPNWTVMAGFDKSRARGAYKLYRCIGRNIKENPGGKEICVAVREHNTDYFVTNFNKIFANLPSEFQKNLNAYKNFLVCPHITEETRNYVWDFFESLLEIFVNEADNLKMVSSF